MHNTQQPWASACSLGLGLLLCGKDALEDPLGSLLPPRETGKAEEKIEEGDPRPLLCSGRADHKAQVRPGGPVQARLLWCRRSRHQWKRQSLGPGRLPSAGQPPCLPSAPLTGLVLSPGCLLSVCSVPGRGSALKDWERGVLGGEARVLGQWGTDPNWKKQGFTKGLPGNGTPGSYQSHQPPALPLPGVTGWGSKGEMQPWVGRAVGIGNSVRKGSEFTSGHGSGAKSSRARGGCDSARACRY